MRYYYITVICLLLSSLSGQGLYDMETINTIELTFTESNWDQILDSYYSAGDEERLIGSAVINGVAFDSVGVRYKGNSSYNANQAKNPLNIKLDHVIDGQTFQGYGTLKLANGYQDPSYVREALGYEIASMYMPASEANYANVYINGNLIGLYTNDQSVDKEFKNIHFPSSRDIRFKGDVVTNGMPQEESILAYLGADSTAYEYYYELKSDYGWSELIEFLDVLNNDTENIEEYLNVDNHLWMLAFDNLTVNLDSPINFSHNYYLFKDASDRFNPIVWDLNEGFGGFNRLLSGGSLSNTALKQLDPLLNVNDNTYPIISKILSNSTYQKMYFAHMRTMMEEVFESGWYEDRANEIQDIIANSISADPNFAYSDSQFASNITSTVTTGGGPMASSTIGITELMEARCTWLRQQSYFSGDVPELVNVSAQENISANSEATITLEATNATNLWINYRSSIYDRFTSVEMFDDGSHNDGQANDSIFGVTIPTAYSDLEYYFYGQNSNQGTFLPAKAAIEFFTLNVTSETGNIVINEINYSSSDEFDAGDWVELYNPTDEAVDLSGWIFRDSDDDHAFVFTANTVLEAYSYLVLTKDTEGFSTVYPQVTNFVGDFDFGLSSSEDAARIYDANLTLIDSVIYTSEGEWPSEPAGTGSTLELINPDLDNSLASSWQASELLGTPGAANSSLTSSVVINEINYSSSDEFDAGDWVELYNPTSEAVDISGWIFKDDDDEHIYEIPANTSLEVGAYLVLTKDFEAFNTIFPEVTNFIGDFDFGLSGSGDATRLYDADLNLIDSVVYTNEGEWPSEPDGNGNTLELISPELDNSLAASWQASAGIGSPGTVNSSGITAIDDNSVQQINLTMANYPNPFNPQTTISFNIKEAGKVTLDIYNLKGQLVKTLVNENMGSGEHTVVWNGENSQGKTVSSGIYFSRLKYSNKTKTHKMTLSK